MKGYGRGGSEDLAQLCSRRAPPQVPRYTTPYPPSICSRRAPTPRPLWQLLPMLHLPRDPQTTPSLKLPPPPVIIQPHIPVYRVRSL